MSESVAPFAGAWIEIYVTMELTLLNIVAPFAGAWIEIVKAGDTVVNAKGSLPSRERGLK